MSESHIPFLDTPIARCTLGGAVAAAAAALGGCANGTPDVVPSASTHEAVVGRDKEAFKLMFEQEALVSVWGKKLLEPVLSKRIELQQGPII